VRLLAAAAALRAPTRDTGFPEEQAERSRLLDSAREHLPPDEWEAAWAAGQAMDVA
jgi:hypothetical protein